ncbi:S1 RNA-binding domain-containing protein [Robertmurraya yapensis]|uniref:S1 RNA-binding domain-containing protein n=1 Tax=Bacillus yapensis TaxID=2492960 RepID=A0A3S0RGW4_9BACI|nr:S1 RNA-binding domain-containing protein [Bacillus yapensis]RTR28101.1 S1 RNA-binding domain-containing protein [Bacillus yapensis]TKS94343.1 S1 RNA-binding domain-containing protein [Bacillus yapensis]
MNSMLQEILQESRDRKWVQYGVVETIRKVDVKGKQEELVVIGYQGESVYARKEDFVERNISSLNGFVSTTIPFIVKEIKDGIVSVSRIEALEKVAKQFVDSAKIGDKVKGTVTGVNENGLVFVEVQGYPCIVPPEEWDFKRVQNLRELLQLGTVVEANIISIDKLEKPEEKVDYRIRLSRKAVLQDEIDTVWVNIEDHFRVGDYVSFKVTGQAKGFNSYYCEFPKGVSLIGNLTTNLRNKHNDYLPPGTLCKGTIKFLDKNKKRGKVTIQQVEANYANLLNQRSFGMF